MVRKVSYLHYYNPEEQTQIGNIVILRREWATDAIYDVLKSNWLLNEKKGRFTEKNLAEIWKDKPQYADYTGALRELMQNFRMCYRVGNTKIHIVPQRLPSSPPNDYHSLSGAPIYLRFKYDFLPKGILTKLTVEMHGYIANKQQLVWRDGFVLEQYGAQAEVKEVYSQREIQIKVTGENRHKLLNEIAYETQKLHKEYYFDDDIQVYTMLPCTCDECKKLEVPKFHRLQDVLKRLEKGKSEKSCPTGDDAEVDEILSIFFRKGMIKSRQGNNALDVDDITYYLQELVQNQHKMLKGQQKTHKDLDFVSTKITNYTDMLFGEIDRANDVLFESAKMQEDFFLKMEAQISPNEKEKDAWYDKKAKEKLKLVLNLWFVRYEKEYDFTDAEMPSNWSEFKRWFYTIEE